MKRFIILCGVAVFGCLGVILGIYLNRPAPVIVTSAARNPLTGQNPPLPVAPRPSVSSTAPENLHVEKSVPSPVESPVVPEAPSTDIPRTAPPKPSAPINPAPSRGKAPILDPEARMALNFVGLDPDAEAYWYGAINDPSLPAEERQDLIEDLNEDGLSNPDSPGPQDLPLIENRLVILAELAGEPPMDKVNADAIQEAAKDLSKMYADLTRQ